MTDYKLFYKLLDSIHWHKSSIIINGKAYVFNSELEIQMTKYSRFLRVEYLLLILATAITFVYLFDSLIEKIVLVIIFGLLHYLFLLMIRKRFPKDLKSCVIEKN